MLDYKGKTSTFSSTWRILKTSNYLINYFCYLPLYVRQLGKIVIFKISAYLREVLSGHHYPCLIG